MCSNSATWRREIFRFQHRLLQCDLRPIGISRDDRGQEKSPRALILKGFLIFPRRLGTVLDLSGGGEEEDRTPDLRIANATLSQLSYPPTAAASLAYAGGRASPEGRRPISE